MSNEGPVLTRFQLLSKSKALSGAQSIVHSHLGMAVIHNNTYELNVYKLELCRLEWETAQRLRQLDRSITHFVDARRRCALKPFPKSHETLDRTVADGRRTLADNNFTDAGYIKPRIRMIRSAPVIPTISAFDNLNTRKSPSGHVTSPVYFRPTVLPLCEEVRRRKYGLLLSRTSTTVSAYRRRFKAPLSYVQLRSEP